MTASYRVCSKGSQSAGNGSSTSTPLATGVNLPDAIDSVAAIITSST